MEDAYGLDTCQVLIDLSDLEDCIYSVCQIGDVGFDVTLFINGMLPLLNNKFMVDQVLDNFLRREVEKISKEYDGFMRDIKVNKIERLKHATSDVQMVGYSLRDKFSNYGLYSRGGTLKVQTMNAQHLSSSIATVKSKIWTPSLNQLPTSSISETPLEYLQRILLSH